MSEAAKSKYSSPAFWIKVVISLFIMFGLGHILPTWSTLTPMGVKQLCTFVGVLFLIGFTGDTIFPCMLAAIAMVFNGFITGGNLFNTIFGNSTVVQQMIFMTFAWAVGQTGAPAQITKKLMTLKAVQGKPKLFFSITLIAIYITAIFMGGAPAILFFFPVWDSICEIVGFDKHKDISKFMLVGIFCSICLGGFILPYKGMILQYIAFFEGMMKEWGYAFDSNQWILIAIISYIVGIIIYVLAFTAIANDKADLKKLKEFNADVLEGFDKQSRKFSYTQKMVLGAFALTMLYSFSLSFKIFSSIKWYNGLTINGVALIFLALLALIPDKTTGKPFVKLDVAFKNGVMWGMIWLMSVFLILGNSIGNAELGITGWLSALMGPIFGNLPWPVFVLLAVLFTCVITNFVSNFTTAMIVMAIVLPFAGKFYMGGINMTALAVAIIRSAMLGYMTYSAFMSAPLLLGREEMSSGWVFKKGWTMLITYVIGTTVICVLFGYLLPSGYAG